MKLRDHQKIVRDMRASHQKALAQRCRFLEAEVARLQEIVDIYAAALTTQDQRIAEFEQRAVA